MGSDGRKSPSGVQGQSPGRGSEGQSPRRQSLFVNECIKFQCSRNENSAKHGEVKTLGEFLSRRCLD